MTPQSFSLIFLIAIFSTTFSIIPLDRFFPYGTTEMGNRARRQVKAHETWRNISNTATVPSMCLPLNQPKNGYCITSHFFEGAEAHCHCFPGFEFPESNNGDEIGNKSVQTLRCQSSDPESADENDSVKSVFWIPEKVPDCKPTKSICKKTNRLHYSDVVVVPYKISITDEYGFDGNNTFHFYCAARGKNVEVFFTRGRHEADDRALGNATEEDMTRPKSNKFLIKNLCVLQHVMAEFHNIFRMSKFLSSHMSTKGYIRGYCPDPIAPDVSLGRQISAKRLTIPYTNAEDAGLYRCYAERLYSRIGKSYSIRRLDFSDHYGKEILMKLERSGGISHVGSEFLCADGRQCISINQTCNKYGNEDCEDGSDETWTHGCKYPDIADMSPKEERLDIPEGGSVTLSCRGVGIGKFFPDPYIRWEVNGIALDCKAPDCHQETKNGTSVLTLKNIKRKNYGMDYSCKAVIANRHSYGKYWTIRAVDKQPGGIKMAENPDEECEAKKCDCVHGRRDAGTNKCTCDKGWQGNRCNRARETWANVSNTAKVPPMCPPLNQPKNGFCLTSHLFEGAEAQCHCFSGFELTESKNGDEIGNKSVQILRCQSSDAESADESGHLKYVSWIPEQVADCEPTKLKKECERDIYDTERLYSPDIVVVPTQISITDVYGFHDGNNTVHFYCAARGKNVHLLFTRDDDQCLFTNDCHLGNATTEAMTRSEIENTFDKEFISSSNCISAKRLTIPFTNAESAGLYRCLAVKPYITRYDMSYTYYDKEIRLKLERSGGMCHNGSELLCADGRQCISINQACDLYRNNDCEDGSDEGHLHGCSMPDIVDTSPKEERLDIPEGGSINFSCRAVGIGKLFPDPYIIWRVDGNDIDCEILNCHQGLENGTSILTLKNIKRTNEGVYYCIAVTNHTHRSITRSKYWYVNVQQPGDINMATNSDEECEVTKRWMSADVVVVPTQMSITDEYGFDGNNTFHFYCAARGKNAKVFFTRERFIPIGVDRHLGNATEEDMTRSEMEQIFDKEFINSSNCISAKRLTIPFINAESAGLYRCFAGKRYNFIHDSVLEFKLKLERSGGMCHLGNEYLCADGRQCISINQTCDQKPDCEDESDEKYSHGCCDVQKKSLYSSDVVVVPKKISITDEYAFHEGNNSVHFYCAARGKDTQVFFSRGEPKSMERRLGNATEKDMTFSEIEQIFDESFVNSSKCITAKRLTIPFTNAESAGAYTCYAKNTYSWTSSKVRLKLERSRGTCRSESEYPCAHGRQCIAKSQLCDGSFHCEHSIYCYNPIIVDMKPDKILLEISEGDSFILTCRAVAYNVPSIKWRVNGTEINCTPPNCQQVSENGTGILTLKNVRQENEGIYTCVAFGDLPIDRTIPRKNWIVKVIGKKPEEIPHKFLGSWKLDHDINYDTFMDAMYTWPLSIAAKHGKRTKMILKNADGSYYWDDGLYTDMVLGKEFECTTTYCIGLRQRIVFVYLPVNETIIETHKVDSKPIFVYRYTLEDGFLVMRMESDKVKAKLFYRKKVSQ